MFPVPSLAPLKDTRTYQKTKGVSFFEQCWEIKLFQEENIWCKSNAFGSLLYDRLIINSHSIWLEFSSSLQAVNTSFLVH